MICKKIESCIEDFEKPRDTWKDSKGGKSVFVLDNSNRNVYSKINFEDCVYEGRYNDTKCDYALISNDTVYFVELKGSDVKKGYEQLSATIKETAKCFSNLSIKVRMVVTRNSHPNLAKKTASYKHLFKVTNNDVIVKVNVLNEKIS